MVILINSFHSRWWPARICFPDEIPTRIQNLSHDVGEFPVMFFGSRDYCWLHAGRVFPYQEGDKGCRGSSKSGTNKIFEKGSFSSSFAYSSSCICDNTCFSFLGKVRQNFLQNLFVMALQVVNKRCQHVLKNSSCADVAKFANHEKHLVPLSLLISCNIVS